MVPPLDAAPRARPARQSCERPLPGAIPGLRSTRGRR